VRGVNIFVSILVNDTGSFGTGGGRFVRGEGEAVAVRLGFNVLISIDSPYHQSCDQSDLNTPQNVVMFTQRHHTVKRHAHAWH
jgi:hypothetical protein